MPTPLPKLCNQRGETNLVSLAKVPNTVSAVEDEHLDLAEWLAIVLPMLGGVGIGC